MPRNSAKRKKDPEPKTKPPVQDPPTPPDQEPPTPPVQVIERRIETVSVDIPLGEPPHRFREIRIDGRLVGNAAHTFAKIRQALKDQGRRTDDGRPVASAADVVRWLLEKIASC